MTIYLEDQKTHFLLHAPDTAKLRAVSKEVGGRKVDPGFKFPRMMQVYDLLHECIPGLNTIEFPSIRGFALNDVGQDAHTKWATLRNYQRATVDLLVSNPHPGMLVRLSPGLGKTPVTLIAADLLGYKNVLIIAVKSLLRTWEREIKMWTPHTGTIRFQEPPIDGWNITNFDTIVSSYKQAHPRPRKDKKTGQMIPAPAAIKDPYMRPWDLIIIDESVLIKSRKALRTAAIAQLRRRTRKMWLLTGSPTTRYADDMWQQLNLVHPSAFTSYWRFAKRYCHVEETVWGNNVVGTRNDRDFVRELRDVMVSYTQHDVLDLPPLLHEKIDLDLTPEQRRVYDELMAAFIAELESGAILSAPNRMARLIRLQQVIANLANVGGGNHSSKSDAVIDLILEEQVRFPLLIWVHWKQGAYILHKRLERLRLGRKEKPIHVAIATGDTPDAEKIIEQYTAGDLQCVILSLEVGKFGHTLTNTRSAIYHDRTFNGDAYYQSLHRLERFGLAHSPQVVTLRCPGTVEEFNVEENLAGKMETVAHVTEADLAKLLRSLGRV